MINAPTPGIYADVPDVIYHAWDAASNSRLGRLAQSPAHLLAYIANPPKETPALKLGRAVHLCILEADKFKERYAIAERCTARKKDGEQCSYDGLVETNQGWRCGIAAHQAGTLTLPTARTMLSSDDYLTCLGMRDAVHRLSTAAALLNETPDDALLAGGPTRELSIVWDDRETGVRCKARLDKLSAAGGLRAIVDLKSTMDASERDFQKSLYNHDYYRQAPFYLSGAQANGLDVEDFVFIASEKDAPHATAMYCPDAGALDAGANLNRELLYRYAKCQRENWWPAYPDTVTDITLPSYAWDQVDSEINRFKRERGAVEEAA